MTGADDMLAHDAAGHLISAPETVDLDGLLRLRGREFVEGAYAVLLLRKPDAGGFDSYLPRLRDGTPKIQILLELAASAESRELGVGLPGLRRAVMLYQLGKLPVVGPLVRSMFGTEGNSRFEARLRAVEEGVHENIGVNELFKDGPLNDPTGVRRLVRNSGLFDADWYREQSPRLGVDVDLLDHFLKKGGFEGRSPSAKFDVKLYLLWYADVRKLGLNPLVHYLLHGKSEKRRYLATAEAMSLGVLRPIPVTMARIVCLKTPVVPAEAAVFITHSADGRIKAHVVHFISELKRNGIGVVLVIAADKPMEDLAHEIDSLVSGLFVRENKGYDFAAWAHVLQLYPSLFAAPILYLINDSIFGPLNRDKFAALLERIRSKNADVIGLTDSDEHEWHLQSYFLAFKPRALSQVPFHRFFNAISILTEKDDVIRHYELKLSSYLRDHGLAVAVIFDAPYIEIPDHRYNKTLFYWKQLIEEGSPFVKVGALRRDHEAIDTTGWREIVAREGYDPSLIDSILAKVPTADEAGFGSPGGDGENVAAFIDRSRPKLTRPLRVSLIGPWNYDNGLGFASRGYITALWHTDFLVNIHAIRTPFHIHKQMAPMVDCRSFSGDADLVIVHLNPDGWFGVLSDEHRLIMARARKIVGAWVWETQKIPENWYPGFDEVDAIWAPSRYCAEVYARSAKVPIEVVPYFIAVRPTTVDDASRQAMRGEFGILRDQRIILYCFDGASYLVRKNPAGLIKAFADSGLARDGWVLILKTKNLFDTPSQGRKLQDQAFKTPGVLLIDRSFDSAMMDVLMNIADIYASSHCSEGFGMTIAEAMALGKIAVATDYGGSRDFLDDKCGYPVPYALHTLTEDHGHYTRGTMWAEVDTTALAESLRKAADKVVSGDMLIGQAARNRIRLNYSSKAVGEAMQRAAAAVLSI
jgi:glycosyltransferase involved in cell wall biosynthesis